MLDEERSADRTGNTREATTIPRRRDSVRKKLAVRRQIREKKKLMSTERDRHEIEAEARDAPSSTAQPTKQNTSPSSDHREEINETNGYGCFLSSLCIQESSNEEDVDNQSKIESNYGSIENPRLSSVTNFHVRLSIGKMNGLKIDENQKRIKESANDGIVVGFVELLGSGKYSALSKPLLIDQEEELDRTRSIFWAKQQDGKESSQSESRRCLHFSLSLKKENTDYRSCGDSYSDDDCSIDPYKPEVVKLLVGLKRGDERLPLGIAKFVVSGREVIQHHMDLMVLPMTDPAAGNKSKRGIFGKKNRTSFKNGKFDFTISRKAKLQIKADVKVGHPGQNGDEIWGDKNCSYASAFDSTAVKRTSSFSTMKVPTFKWKGKKASQNRSYRKRSHRGKDNTSSGRDYCQDSKAPMCAIALNESDEISTTSDISSRPGCANAWACEPLQCLGYPTEGSSVQDHGHYNEDFGTESEEMSENEIENFIEDLRSFNSIGNTTGDSVSYQ